MMPIFISAQPQDLQFLWEVEVQIVNFRKHGISENMHILVWYPDNEKRAQEGGPIEELYLDRWSKLAKKYPEVHFEFYKDEGVELEWYVPQIRPHILARHFDKFPELSKQCIFYHDADIIFHYLPDFKALSKGDINWTSNTSHYLDYDYLSKKERKGSIPKDLAISKLCEIGNISIDTLKSYNGRTGGAQYLLKGIDGDFWRDVEKQVIEIRKAFYWGDKSNPNIGSVNHTYFRNENDGFQSWCADMWAVNFALWSRGKTTDVTPELDFSWATDTAKTYLEKPIYHNAGDARTQPGTFNKRAWHLTSPIGKNHAVRKTSASWYYVQAIKEVKLTP